MRPWCVSVGEQVKYRAPYWLIVESPIDIYRHTKEYSEATNLGIFVNTNHKRHLSIVVSNLTLWFADRRLMITCDIKINNNNSVRCVDSECLNEPPVSCRWCLMNDTEVYGSGTMQSQSQPAVKHVCKKDSTSHACTSHDIRGIAVCLYHEYNRRHIRNTSQQLLMNLDEGDFLMDCLLVLALVCLSMTSRHLVALW